MESLNYNTTLNNNDDDAAHMSDNALATHIHGMKCTKPNNENINRGFDVSQKYINHRPSRSKSRIDPTAEIATHRRRHSTNQSTKNQL